MNTIIRWGKFNLVGAMGMAVQLGALALLERWDAGHYLYASTAALEITLLHNFVWHMHYTWKDRRYRSALLTQLTRFHLSNGLVSMVGNLALMRVLVDGAHMPLLAANGIAILCCSVINFILGDNWAFKDSAVAARRQRWTGLAHFRFWCLLSKWTDVLSHPFHKLREMDGAPRIL
ncbi:MAG: GtrA family protein [Terracidiphilus sp.]